MLSCSLKWFSLFFSLCFFIFTHQQQQHGRLSTPFSSLGRKGNKSPCASRPAQLQQRALHTVEQLPCFSQWREQNLHPELICFTQPVVSSKSCFSSTAGSTSLSVCCSAPLNAHPKASLKSLQVFQNSNCKQMHVLLFGAWSWDALHKWSQSGHLPCKRSWRHWLAFVRLQWRPYSRSCLVTHLWFISWGTAPPID